MALSKPIPTDMGVTANYHRIVSHEISFVAEADIPGCKGSVFVQVASYASAMAREQGAAPLAMNAVRVRFGAQVANEANGKPVLAVQSDEPTRAQLYGALAQTPTFDGATSA